MEKLRRVHWQNVSADRKMTLVKFASDPDHGYVVCFSDLKGVFVGRTSVASMKDANADLNEHLDVESDRHLLDNIEKCVCAFRDGSPLAKIEEFFDDDEAIYKCKTRVKVGGRINFVWEFEAARQSDDSFLDLLVDPLLRTCAALQAQKSLLLSVVAAKDAEIEDYRLSGAKVSRKILATRLFKPDDDLENESEIDSAFCRVGALRKKEKRDSTSNDAKADPPISGDGSSAESSNDSPKSENREKSEKRPMERQRPSESIGKKAKVQMLRNKKLGL